MGEGRDDGEGRCDGEEGRNARSCGKKTRSAHCVQDRRDCMVPLSRNWLYFSMVDGGGRKSVARGEWELQQWKWRRRASDSF